MDVIRPMTTALISLALTAGLFPGPPAARAQIADGDAIASWVAADVPSGYEERTTPELAARIEGWTSDRWGNLVRETGAGAPRTVVACALDAPAFAVTQITDEGYLRLHRIGRGSRHPLWDQHFEAQQVRILTRSGPVAGVIARTNGHFAAQHRGESDIPDTDDLWLDVGAASSEEVDALGIELLDPVVRHLPPWTLAGGQIAGPAAGRRAGCAAVATLAEVAAGDDGPGHRVTFVLSGREEFGWVGLSSHLARAEPIDRLVLVGPGEGSRSDEVRTVERMGRFGDVLGGRGLDSVRVLAPAVTAVGSHVERIEPAEVDRLLRATAVAAGVELPEAVPWVPAPPRRPLGSGLTRSADPSGVAATLDALVELHGAPGHEWAVRRFLLEALPAWARERAVVDGIGNVVVEMGPERDTTVFMAHLDEVGYEVESVADDGVVTLGRLGGALNTAWEGQTALLHFDPPGAPSTSDGDGTDLDPRWKAQSLRAEAPEPLRGVFLTRESAESRDPPGGLRAWFGLDGAELRARGVRPGMQVTSYKEGLRIGPHRFVGRGLDDRAGTTALLHAIQRIDPASLDAKVIFAWSVHEEGGLIGSEVMARRYATGATRIYSVDTFVSSDTPLESPHFAFTPLGRGPVFRAIENSGVSPDAERDRVRRIADAAGIPLQIGLTQGSTDGTTFTFRGAPNQGLSWPGRYSHSPGEVLDLRDLRALIDLVVRVAQGG